MYPNQIQHAWRCVQPAVGFATEIVRRHYHIVDQIMLPLLDPDRHKPIHGGIFALECIVKVPMGPIDTQIRGELYWAAHDIQSVLATTISKDFMQGWRTAADAPDWKPPEPKDATERTMRMTYVACDLACKCMTAPAFLNGQQVGHHLALIADMTAAGCEMKIVEEMLQRWRLLDAHDSMGDAEVMLAFNKKWQQGECAAAYDAVKPAVSP
jgi:hypothetical protein